MRRSFLLSRTRRRIFGIGGRDVAAIVGVLEHGDVRVVVCGGWGVDALVGRRTRRHRDLDILVDEGDEMTAHSLLVSRGFELVESGDVEGAAFWRLKVYADRLGRLLELHPVRLGSYHAVGAVGAVGAARSGGRLPLPALARADIDIGRVGGMSLHCLSREAQLQVHRGYPMRFSDLSDLDQLGKLGPGEEMPDWLDGPARVETMDHGSPGLRAKSLESAAYLFAREGVGLVVRLGGVLAVARLIGARDFGLYAAAGAIATLAATVAQLGVEIYLVRDPHPTDRSYDVAFTLLAATSLTVAAGLIGTAVVAPWIFGPRGVAPLVEVLCAALPLNVLWAPAQARLEREFRFRALATLEIVCDIALYVVAVPAAVLGLSSWSLVAGTLVWQALRLAGSYRLAAYLPRPRWSFGVIRQMVWFGIPASAVSWRGRGVQAVVVVAIGRELGAAMLGSVSLAWRAVIMLNAGGRATWRVALNALARSRKSRSSLTSALGEATLLEVLALGIPLVVVGLALPLVSSSLLGPGWQHVSSVFPGLAVAALGNALVLVLGSLYMTRFSPGGLAVAGVASLGAVGVVAAASVAALGPASVGLAVGVGAIVAAIPLVRLERSGFVGLGSLRPGLVWVAALGPLLFLHQVAPPARLVLVLPIVLPLIDRSTRKATIRATRSSIGALLAIRDGLRQAPRSTAGGGRRRWSRAAARAPRRRKAAAAALAVALLGMAVAATATLGVGGTGHRRPGAGRAVGSRTPGASPDPATVGNVAVVAGPPAIGVYGGPGAVAKVVGFERSEGISSGLAMDYVSDASWSTISDPVWNVQAWRGSGLHMIWAVPMLPASGGSLAEGAAGSYDAQFQTLGKLLVANGQGSATIMLGWDPNVAGLPWSASGPSQQALYVQFWQRIVAVMRGVQGAHFRFEWDVVPVAGTHVAGLYPGDAYVDVVATDVFDVLPTPPPAQMSRWTLLSAAPGGVESLATFASLHHKPLAIAALGLVPASVPGGGGDDPSFVTQALAWCAVHSVVSVVIWDQGSYGLGQPGFVGARQALLAYLSRQPTAGDP